MDTIFFTGFPGFLGSELLPRALARHGGATALCLVQPKFVTLAERRAHELATRHPEIEGRIRIVQGDITRPELGLDDAATTQADVTEIYHLAAVYDLSVSRELSMRVNVDGTRRVLDFAGACPRLTRLQYVSTCYVSGRYQGTFYEADLEKGQSFSNYYEETKYLAEVEVRERIRDGLPTTIYRPGIVVGDSTSGATQKYDGPYYLIQWILRHPPGIAVVPVIGNPRKYYVNFVPRDYVVDAIAHLSGLESTAGKTYQLADPNPLTVDEVVGAMGRATDRRVVKVPLTRKLAKGAIERVPGVAKLLRIPSSLVDYFDYPVRYDTANALADLAGSGIECPPFPSYLPRLVDFVRQHPEVSSEAMV